LEMAGLINKVIKRLFQCKSGPFDLKKASKSLRAASESLERPFFSVSSAGSGGSQVTTGTLGRFAAAHPPQIVQSGGPHPRNNVLMQQPIHAINPVRIIRYRLL